jgi:hypothetical protein
VQGRPGNTPELRGVVKDFFSIAQMAQELRQRIDKWEYRKLQSFCTTKEMVCKLKRLPTEW